MKPGNAGGGKGPQLKGNARSDEDRAIGDEPNNPRKCSEVADGVARPMGVRLFREPDAVTPPVRFDEREQETEPSQTGLRRAKRKLSPSATGRLKPLRLFSTLPN